MADGLHFIRDLARPAVSGFTRHDAQPRDTLALFHAAAGAVALRRVMSGLFSAVTVLQPWPMKLLVDYALGDAGMFAGLDARRHDLGRRWRTLGLFLINVLLDVVVSWTWMATGQRMVYDLAADVFKRSAERAVSLAAAQRGRLP